jgi:hypothetical protein
MSTSSIDKELIWYFTRLDEEQKKSLLGMIKTFLSPTLQVVEKMSLDQYNKELNEAMDRIQKGEFTTLEELEKEMQAW